MEPSHRLVLTLALTCLFVPAANAGAAVASSPAPATVRAETDAKTRTNFDQLRKMAEGHPNELYRIYAAEAAESGRWGDAVRLFTTAASYADKYSQHRLSLLHWHGVGTPVDRATAYVWSDLAAERGYPQFLAIREKMWGELTEQEQARVKEIGPAYYRKYGDPVAKKRFAMELGKSKRKATGSHTGFVGNLAIVTPGAGMSLFDSIGGADLTELYGKSRWDAQAYWKIEDVLWKQGSVEVGPVENAPDAKAGPSGKD